MMHRECVSRYQGGGMRKAEYMGLGIRSVLVFLVI